MLQCRPNITQIQADEGSTICIAGDIHGNLEAILQFFELNGLPAAKSYFIFNGDFVDRGLKSVEVLSIVLSAFIAFPNHVVLNRGNHEDVELNSRYGFQSEISMKFPNEEKRLMELCSNVFRNLPLATVVNQTIFVCHGGIFPSSNLKHLQMLRRDQFSSVFNPPLGGSNAVDVYDWQQILNLLWNDPREKPGCQPNTYRGAGSHFGPDVTSKFLQETGYRLLVRSHECVPEGWATTHNGLVLTIFSSFDYFGHNTNTGAFLRLNITTRAKLDQICSLPNTVANLLPIDEHPKQIREGVPAALAGVGRKQRCIVIHIVALKRTDLDERLANMQRIKNETNVAFLKLWNVLHQYKTEILVECSKEDTDGTGLLPSDRWCSILTKITNLRLPWRYLRPFLVQSSTADRSLLLYNSMYRQPCVTHPMLKDHPELAEKLFENQRLLRSTIHSLSPQDPHAVDLGLLCKRIEARQCAAPQLQPLKILLENLSNLLKPNECRKFDVSRFMNSFQFVQVKFRPVH